MKKHTQTKTAVLTAILLLVGAGTANAGEVSLCEYWHGDDKACDRAFASSPAKRIHRCIMFAKWGESMRNNSILVNAADLTDRGRNYLMGIKEHLGDKCECDVRFLCPYQVEVSAYYHGRRLSGHTTHQTRTTTSNCTATLEALRSVNVRDGSQGEIETGYTPGLNCKQPH